MNTFSTIIIWLVIVLYVLSTLLTVSQVGKARKVLNPETAALAALLHLCVIVGLLFTLWSNR